MHPHRWAHPIRVVARRGVHSHPRPHPNGNQPSSCFVRQGMEKINLGDDGFAVHLHTPICEFKREGCTTKATAFYRMHSCKSYYACDNCDKIMMEILLRNYTRLKHLHCKTCGKQYSLNGYVDVERLNDEANS